MCQLQYGIVLSTNEKTMVNDIEKGISDDDGDIDVIFLMYVELGFINIVQWFCINYLQYLHDHITDAIEIACKQGHLTMIKWFHSNFETYFTVSCMDNAIIHRQWHVLFYLHHNRNEGCSVDVMQSVLEHKDVLMAIWLCENRHEQFNTYDMYKIATEMRLLEMLQYLHSKNVPCRNLCLMGIAVEYGHLDIVIWLYNSGIDTNVCQIIKQAAVKGHLPIIKWMYENTEPTPACTKHAITLAIEFSNINCASYLISNNGGGVDVHLNYQYLLSTQ